MLAQVGTYAGDIESGSFTESGLFIPGSVSWVLPVAEEVASAVGGGMADPMSVADDDGVTLVNRVVAEAGWTKVTDGVAKAVAPRAIRDIVMI